MRPTSSSAEGKQPASASTSTSDPPVLDTQTILLNIFKAFEDYKFTEDPLFNAGLPTVFDAIRGKKMTPGLIDKTIAEAQWFYWTKMRNLPIPFSAYQSYIDQPHDTPTPPLASCSSASGRPAAGTEEESEQDPTSRIDNITEAMRMMGSRATSKTIATRPEEGSLGGGTSCDGVIQTELTFEALCKLIREGKAGDLKGKDIPDELNATPPSEPALQPRLKPWQSRSTVVNPSVSTSYSQNQADSLRNPISPGAVPPGPTFPLASHHPLPHPSQMYDMQAQYQPRSDDLLQNANLITDLGQSTGQLRNPDPNIFANERGLFDFNLSPGSAMPSSTAPLASTSGSSLFVPDATGSTSIFNPYLIPTLNANEEDNPDLPENMSSNMGMSMSMDMDIAMGMGVGVPPQSGMTTSIGDSQLGSEFAMSGSSSMLPGSGLGGLEFDPSWVNEEWFTQSTTPGATTGVPSASAIAPGSGGDLISDSDTGPVSNVEGHEMRQEGANGK